jgi:hypothetical protein
MLLQGHRATSPTGDITRQDRTAMTLAMRHSFALMCQASRQGPGGSYMGMQLTHLLAMRLCALLCCSPAPPAS